MLSADEEQELTAEEFIMNKTYDMIIVGGGPGGYTAAL